MGQNGLFHASSGSQIHLLTTVHPEIASRGSQWPVRRAGVPGEGAVTTVTAWPTVTRVREVRDQPTNIWRPGVRRVGDHPTNPGPGVGEQGWQLGKTLGCAADPTSRSQPFTSLLPLDHSGFWSQFSHHRRDATRSKSSRNGLEGSKRGSQPLNLSARPMQMSFWVSVH